MKKRVDLVVLMGLPSGVCGSQNVRRIVSPEEFGAQLS